jgi:hypothetical protein
MNGRPALNYRYSALEFLPISSLDQWRSRTSAPLVPPVMSRSRDLRLRMDGAAQHDSLLSSTACARTATAARCLVAPRKAVHLPVRTKFEIGGHESLLPSRFVEFLNTRHVTGRAACATEIGIGRDGEQALLHLAERGVSPPKKICSAPPKSWQV